MSTKIPLFKKNRILGGYSIAVRDDWNYHIRTTHITDREKDLYLNTIGEKIITYNEFIDWWCMVNNYGKYALAKKDQ
jgi:hypothetical protein